MDMDKEFTINDFFENAKVLLFNNSFREDSYEKDTVKWCIISALKGEDGSRDFSFSLLFEELKVIFPKLKRKDMEIVWEKYHFLRNARASGKPKPFNGRFLSTEKYNAWAERVWKKRGCPQFRKQIINGVIFGKPETKLKRVRSGGFPRNVVVHRFIGVEVIDGVRIKMSVEG